MKLWKRNEYLRRVWEEKLNAETYKNSIPNMKDQNASRARWTVHGLEFVISPEEKPYQNEKHQLYHEFPHQIGTSPHLPPDTYGISARQ